MIQTTNSLIGLEIERKFYYFTLVRITPLIVNILSYRPITQVYFTPFSMGYVMDVRGFEFW